MSGWDAGKRPDTDAQWARDVEHRLAALEGQRTAVRIGGWVISEQGGELVATTTAGVSAPVSAFNIDALESTLADGSEWARIVEQRLAGLEGLAALQGVFPVIQIGEWKISEVAGLLVADNGTSTVTLTPP